MKQPRHLVGEILKGECMSYTASNVWMPLFTTQLDAQRRYFELWRDMTQALLLPGRSTRRDLVPTIDQTREQVVALGEEVLDVSTRRVAGNATRVRRVVKEIPVERHVEVHDETIIVERRPANGQQAGDDAVAEREWVMIDTREIPVVSKHVKLREELVLRRQETGRVEIIRDTLRHADADIVQPPRVPMVIAPDESGERQRHDGGSSQHEKREQNEKREQKVQAPEPGAAPAKR
jgi:uncharacterized protein (TIGR02271 family)